MGDRPPPSGPQHGASLQQQTAPPRALGITLCSPPVLGYTCLGITSPCSLAAVRLGMISSAQHVARTQPCCSSRAARVCGSTATASWQSCKGPRAGPWASGHGDGGDAALAAAKDGGSERRRLLLSHFPLSQARGTERREPQPSGKQGQGWVSWRGGRALAWLPGGFSGCGGEGTHCVTVLLPCFPSTGG